jgi:hypothetical protein
MKSRQLFRCLGVLWLLCAGSVLAHGTRAGDLTIDHPYAVPTLAGVSTGALYFRAITNNGNEPDQLLSARTKVADSVDLHHMQMDGNVMRMRAVAAIELPARTEVRLRHGSAAAAAEGLPPDAQRAESAAEGRRPVCRGVAVSACGRARGDGVGANAQGPRRWPRRFAPALKI